MKPFILFFTLAFTLSGATFWYSHLLENEFTGKKLASLDTSLTKATKMISEYLDSRRIYLGLYAASHTQKLTELVYEDFSDEQIERIEENMRSQLKKSIPEYLSFAIKTVSGEIIPDEFNDKIGKSCRDDLSHYTEVNQSQISAGVINITQYVSYQPTIHPSQFHYHFDMASPWQDSTGVLHTISILLNPDFLAAKLLAREMDGHQLIITKKNNDTLIELSSQGDRSHLGEAIHLNKQEQAALFGQRAIPESRWNIAYIINSKIFDTYKKQLLLKTWSVCLLIWLLVFSVYFFVKKNTHGK